MAKALQASSVPAYRYGLEWGVARHEAEHLGAPRARAGARPCGRSTGRNIKSHSLTFGNLSSGAPTNSQKYVAISGGVQDTDSGTNMTTNDDQVAIAASFPGRMDFNTFTPKPFRTDGWIVQFAHVGAQDDNLAVWALCVPVADFGGSIPVHVNS